jgi:hypothetical protein
MAADQFFLPYRPILESTLVVPGAQILFTLSPGTNTKAPVYAEAAMTNALQNPVVADGVGKFPPVYMSDAISYRVRVYSRTAVVGVDTPIEDYDPYVPGVGLDETLRSDLASEALDMGTALISYVPATGVAAVDLFTALRLSLPVVPQHFGAVGGGIADDTAEVQAFWDYVFANDVPHDGSGTYGISNAGAGVGVYIGPAVAPSSVPPRPIVGWQRLVALGPMNEMVHRRNLQFRTWIGGLEPIGTGGSSFASRTCLIGIHEENNARLFVTGGSRPANFALAGEWFGSPNNNAMNTGPIRASHCGSGSASGSLTGNWSTPVNSGSGNGQRTTVNLTTFPTSTLLDYFVAGSEAIYVRLNGVSGAKFYVYSWDTIAGTVSLFPQIDTAVYGSSGTFQWCFGGGYVTRGSDSNIVDVPFLDCTNCGNGRNDGTLYPSRVRSAQFNSCGTDEHFGKSPSGAISGAFSQAAYTESTNSYEQVTWAGRFGSTSFGLFTAASGGTDLSKWFMLGDPLGTGGEAGALGVGGLAIINKGRVLWQTKPNITHGTGSTYNLSGQSRPLTPEIFQKDSITGLQLQIIGSGENNRLFGYTGGIVGFVGTGTSGAPTGSFPFLPPTKDYTGTIAIGTPDVAVASTAGLVAGMPITGTGVPAASTVLSITDATHFKLSANATTSGAQTLTVTGSVNGTYATVTYSTFSGPVMFAYDHTDLYQLVWIVRPLSGWRLRGTATWDPPSIAAAAASSTTVTVTGAAFGDAFVPSFSIDIGNLIASATVSSANTVTVKLFNPTAGAIDLASLTATATKVS